MNSRLASMDIGNDALKGYLNGFETTVYIPNVIAKVEDRQVVEYEKEELAGLHVEITSSALKSKNGRFAVGKLAMQYDNNDELTTDKDKHNNDQTLILLLTSLAYDAAINLKAEDNIVEASYILSTGLPLAEAANRKDFRKKLKSTIHEVKFLKTPKLEGKTVRITFHEVLVNTEGFAAYMDLMMDNDGSDRNVELQGKTLMINDIGGLSTDTAIITADGSIDNTNSKGVSEGVSPYLDEIIESVYNQYKYTFKSRRELIEIITSEDPEERNHIFVKSNRTAIDHIVNPILQKLAESEYKHISRVWDRVPAVRYSYQIGGGSLILRPYLKEINEREHKFALRFLKKEESIWMIARAYLKILMVWSANQGIETPLLATNK